MRTLFVLAVALSLAACGGSSSKAKPKTATTQKAGGAKSAEAAKTSSQKAGSAVTDAKGSATSKGETDGGVACDGSLEGVGFCASDTAVVFCAGGEWWALDCSALDAEAFCGVDSETAQLDCWVE